MSVFKLLFISFAALAPFYAFLCGDEEKEKEPSQLEVKFDEFAESFEKKVLPIKASAADLASFEFDDSKYFDSLIVAEFFEQIAAERGDLSTEFVPLYKFKAEDKDAFLFVARSYRSDLDDVYYLATFDGRKPVDFRKIGEMTGDCLAARVEEFEITKDFFINVAIGDYFFSDDCGEVNSYNLIGNEKYVITKKGKIEPVGSQTGI